MLVVHLVAFFLLRSSLAAPEQWVNLDLYRALTKEGVLIWAVLLAGGALLNRVRRSSFATSAPANSIHGT
jgi:hypothetical protein